MLTDVQNQLLEMLSCALFKNGTYGIEKDINWIQLKEEAFYQAVFTIVYPVIEKVLPNEISLEWKKTYTRHRAKNMKIDFEHVELHNIMTNAKIPYTVLKGFSSAYYYPNPFDRMMGDVDFLVNKSYIEDAGKALIAIGFEGEKHERSVHHNEFYRGKSVWELHYSMGSIPNGVCGERVKKQLSRFIERAQTIEYSGVTCTIPCEFDHGLCMLVHVAKHITNGEGIGLRHLCDWAVYVNQADISKYEKELKELGLWVFACQLTFVSSKYLGSRKYEWCDFVSDAFADWFIDDIFAAGNFGQKVENRSAGYRIIKQGNLFSSLAARAIDYYPFSRKNKLLLPLGMVMYFGVFLRRRFKGEKKWVKISSVKDGMNRKKLYEQFRLYEAQ